ncbi:DUF2177 domain-containing protein [Candidatus Parcubacteria bacterium]|nr:MAG: DUF2177 domain-containing protein [Candidatus Parcubacteria bacterium]
MIPQIIKLYLISVPVFFAIDLLWLGVVARSFYVKYLGEMLKSPPNWTAAVIFYLLFLLGLVVFVIEPAVAKDSLKYALFMGAFFGFITYMTYDLTNLATLKNWPIEIVIVDIIWGAVLSMSVSAVTFYLFKIF